MFRETRQPLKAYDGHHIAIYITDFSGTHAWLKERGIVSEESNEFQYRFNDIVDPASGEKLFEIEHEVRSFTHPMYARPLVNRGNPCCGRLPACSPSPPLRRRRSPELKTDEEKTLYALGVTLSQSSPCST